MKKILAAFDGIRFSESTLDYAIFLAQQSYSSISGVFLSEATRLSYAVYETMIEQSNSGKSILNDIEKSDREIMNKSIQIFESKCQKSNVNYSVHRDNQKAIHEIIHETTFADLLVMDANETFSYLESEVPGRFVKDILHNTMCPVIVVPNKFTPIKELVFLYDGSAASIHSIKMFSYTLPGMKKMKTRLICARGESGSSILPDNLLLKEWLAKHFSKVQYKTISGGEKEIILDLSADNPGLLIVTGAYNRSNISMWLHRSFADQLINEVRAPVFLARL